MGDKIRLNSISYGRDGKASMVDVTYTDESHHGGHQDPYPEYYRYEINNSAIRGRGKAYGKPEVVVRHIQPMLTVFNNLPKIPTEYDIEGNVLQEE